MSTNQLRNITNELKLQVDTIVDQLNLQGFTISFDGTKKALHFKKGFKEATVSLVLIERQQWADIRQIFRAVFQSGPQVENFSAQNEWSRWTDK